MKFKVCVVGDAQSGKSSVKKLLTKESSDFHAVKESPDLGVFQLKDKAIQLWIYYLPSQPNHKYTNAIFAQYTDIFIYCVDTSQELAPDKINQIKRECQRLKTQYSNAQVLLVGTKSDIALSETLAAFSEAFSHYPAMTTSIHNHSEHANLVENTVYFAAVQKIKNALFKLPKETMLSTLLTQFTLEIREQQRFTQITLALKLEQLVNFMLNPKEMDKAGRIQDFVADCNAVLLGEEGKDLRPQTIIKAIAVAFMVALVAGLIGYFIGFSLGAWSGPGAFFTGLATGMISALTVLGAMIFLGGLTFSYSLSELNKPTPFQEIMDEISKSHEFANLSEHKELNLEGSDSSVLRI